MEIKEIKDKIVDIFLNFFMLNSFKIEIYGFNADES